MEIRQLEYFTTIVREGSFSRAALKLHIGQPALSKQIQALERDLGVALLLRGPEGVRPTAAGLKLEEMAQHLLAYADDVRSAVRDTAASIAGAVTLGLSPSLVPALAAHLEQRVAEKHPEVRLTIVEALPMFLAEWLDSGRLDLGVFTRPGDPAPPRLALTDVGRDEVMLVATDDLLATVADRPTPDMLRSVRVALTPGFRDLMRTSLGWEPAHPGDSAIDSIHLVRDLALRGTHCSVLPYSYVRQDVEAGALSAVSFMPPVHRTLVTATRAHRRPSPAVREVVALVTARLVELAELRGRSRVIGRVAGADVERAT